MRQAILNLSVISLSLFLLTPGDLHAVVRSDDQSVGGTEISRPDIHGTPALKQRPQFKEDEILVKFKASVPEGRKENSHKKHKALKLKEFKSLRLHHVKLEKGMSVEEAIELYRADPDVEYAEPDGIFELQVTPNDPGYSQLWGMTKINAPAAWDSTTGSSSIVVAVIDSGVDYTHPDLAANMWVNPGETGENGIDDDGNGYVDDIHGIDPFSGDTIPADEYGHGTHVAGTIGGAGNNAVGVSGVNWQVGILACKAGDAEGYIYMSSVISCLQYLRAMKDRGVNIVASNNSWGGSSFYQSLFDAIKAQGDILFIASAGNDNKNNDTSPTYPAGYSLPNVVAVAATTSTDSRASFSNYGKRTVHVGAPGNIVYSTLNGGGYGNMSGTSMAAPHVTGLAALLKAHNPGRDWLAVRNLILSGGDTISSMTGTTISGKRISAYGSLNCTNGKVFSVLQYPGAVTIGTPVTLTALSIGCELPLGPVTVTTSASETITLHDDGIAPDVTAGDGVFSGIWTPARVSEILTFSSPAGSETLVISPLKLSSSYVHEGNTRVAYSYFLQATGGLPPYAWAIVSGSLPPGLTLNGVTGEITGTLTTTGSYIFSATVTDALNQTVTKSLSMRVVSDPVIEIWGVSYDYGYAETSKAVAVDSIGNVFHTGDSVSGMTAVFLTTKQDPSGTVGWNGIFWDAFSPGYAYWSHGIAVDGNSNIFVAGERFSSTGYICRYLKYTPAGARLWYRTINSARCSAVTTSANSIYLAGNQISGTNYSGLVAKADNNGVIQWTKTFDTGASEYFNGIAVDGSGNSYVTGQTNNGTYNDLILAKYDPSGNLVWSTSYGNPLQNETGNGIATDTSGNIYVAGVSATNGAILTIKYDSSGGVVWERIYTGTSSANAIATDTAGNVYVAGPHILKYNAAGDLLWTRNIGSGNASGIALDLSGNIIVSSTLYNSPNNDYLTLKYYELPVVITETLPAAIVGTPYSQIVAVTGGKGPYTWSVVSGALPAGMTLTPSSGVISGTPSSPGISNFTVRVTDVNSYAATQDLSITIDGTPLAISTASLPSGTPGVFYSQTLAASGGVPPYTWTVLSGMLPGGMSLNPATGAVAGTPAATGVFSFTARVAAMGETATKALAITITDSVCANSPVRIQGITPAYSPDFFSAYSLAADNDFLQFQALNFSGDFLLNRNLQLTLAGGYDCGFTANAEVTTLLGKLRVGDGTAKIDKLRFK